MPIPQEALLDEEEQRNLRVTIGNRLQYGKDFWRPLNVRQDLWSLMYFLQDIQQQMKPVNYRRFISNEPRCVTPETRVLTADARWIPAGELQVGQRLLAFEDVATPKRANKQLVSHARHHQWAVITQKELKVAPVYKITFADGRTVRATGEHKWLVKRRGRSIDWLSTEYLAMHFARRVGKYSGKHGLNAGKVWMTQYFEPWAGGDDDRDTGYLAGAFDADGSLYRKTAANHWPVVEFTQYDNACLHEVKAALTRKGFEYSEEEQPSNGEQPFIYRLILRGGRSEVMRFLGQVRPPRLLDRWAAMRQDDVELRSMGLAEIVSVEPDGDAPIVALTSSSGTYHTEFGASHNTAVDLAQSILTRNEVFWRIALNEMTGENPEERRSIGKVERTVQGMIYDIDEMFSMRGLMRFWKTAASQALLRGWIWGKVHVTTEALVYRDSPLLAEIYDSRLVFPHFDMYGLNYVLIQRLTTLGDLVNMYPEKFGDREIEKNFDPNRQVIKIEYWSNDRGTRKGINAVLAIESPPEMTSTYDMFTALNMGNAEFIIEPYYHGYTPRELPVVGVPANGINVVTKPQLGDMLAMRLAERAELLGTPTAISWWQGNNSWVAESGRSILSAVEEHVPQYNELVATIFQHLSIGTYGNWVFTTPTGQIPAFEPGIEGKIALTPEEKLQRIEIGPMSQDAYKLVQLLTDEKNNAMLSNILKTNAAASGSGVLFQQQANAALNSLEPFQDSLEEFGQRIGTSLIAQIQRAAPILQPWDVVTGGRNGRNKSLFVIQFDASKDLDPNRAYRVRPVFKPALPDDLAIRINSARLALDPRRPILSLTTVLENILQVDDPMEEIDRIWEDMANNDPVIVLEQIADALIRMDEPELAQKIRENQFQTQFVKEMQFRQQTGQGMGNSPTAAVGMQSQAGSPQSSQTGMGAQGGGSEASLMSGTVPAPWSDFKGELGSMGMRREV